ncbi:pentapeptide repeat-containing protein [Streptomyces sp. NRRL_B-2557]|uniref:pentapeptide repeat-containing protein n=1 Tax=Streptomyces sp. NRRL_B-2557 TaxID=3028698 RepID=UPI0029CAA7D4|nr:pentapeptide repeat-containing protein [Streptomyces sp. NRRL_B-2557]
MDRDAYLAGLTPGTSIDHRGTPFTQPLLDALLNALRDPTTGHPLLGEAQFEAATFMDRTRFGSATFQGIVRFGSAAFQDDAGFEEATFKDIASFESAAFQSYAWFGSATFERGAMFKSATFRRDAAFEEATFKEGAWFQETTFQKPARFRASTFKGPAQFDSAAFQRGAGFGSATFQNSVWFRASTFQDHAWFSAATFEHLATFEAATFESDARFEAAIFKGDAGFNSTTFQGDAEFKAVTFQEGAWFRASTFQKGAGFEEATFQGDAKFEQAVFERSVSLGPLACAGTVKLSGAVFSSPVTLSLATRRLECRRTRWSSTAEVRLRYATVDFSHAVFEYPLTIAAEPALFVLTTGQPMDEQALASTPDAAVRLASLRGVDAAHLVLADVDLSGCLFTGTVHLDQLRLEGTCSFDTVPPGTRWQRWPPIWFTRRHTLAEEHHWRASQPGTVPGWNVAVLGAGHAGPAQLAPVYRALRKSFEDGKDEPGAADFYYGEMEMRRRNRTGTTRAERGLLHGYWLLSGYGLRASRALGWLAAAMLITIVLLMGFGLPQDSPKQEATGTVPPGGGKVTFEIDKKDPRNPTGDRITGKRFEKALNVTLNSVVFRSSGQDLTTTGTYIEMGSRVSEPILLGLAILAIRNRVKR